MNKKIPNKNLVHIEIQRQKDMKRLHELEEYFSWYYNTCILLSRMEKYFWLDDLNVNERVLNTIELQLLREKYKSDIGNNKVLENNFRGKLRG